MLLLVPRRREQERMRWLGSITDSVDMNLSKLGDSEGQGSLVCCSPWGRREAGRTWRLNNNTNEKTKAQRYWMVHPRSHSPLVGRAWVQTPGILAPEPKFSATVLYCTMPRKHGAQVRGHSVQGVQIGTSGALVSSNIHPTSIFYLPGSARPWGDRNKQDSHSPSRENVTVSRGKKMQD